MSFSPAVRRRELATILRGYRERLNLDGTKVSRQLEWDPSKISRIEGGRFRRINTRDVLDLLTIYGVTDEREREALAQIARDSRARGWWDEYGDVFRSELPNLEAGATGIRSVEALCLPGLLQTPDYAEAMFQGLGIDDRDQLARRVAARMARQEILVRENPPHLAVIVDEVAFAKLVGGPVVMGEQLRQLIQVAAWPNVEIRLIPNSVGAHPAMCGSFTILEFDAHPPIVFSETPIGPVLSEKPDEIELYASVYQRLMATAISPEETLSVMRAMARATSEE
ncbi:helix-turn-helix domain-containing protein [Microbispora rosea]|uniref:helix-turn-helix domain-containing protein n=1 Tax=Microbispora rosea TaxID=58117 RepID=UPI0037AA3556